MEEVPSRPNNIELKPGHSADPEQIGDLLLRFEIPHSEPAPKSPALVIDRNPKFQISHENLRAKVRRYKEQKLSRAKIAANIAPTPEQLTEVHFDKRREAIGNASTAESQENSTAADTYSVYSSPQPAATQAPPPVPPPMLADSSSPTPQQLQKTISIVSYKKPLLMGLGAGIITGLILIFVYLIK